MDLSQGAGQQKGLKEEKHTEKEIPVVEPKPRQRPTIPGGKADPKPQE